MEIQIQIQIQTQNTDTNTNTIEKTKTKYYKYADPSSTCGPSMDCGTRNFSINTCNAFFSSLSLISNKFLLTIIMTLSDYQLNLYSIYSLNHLIHEFMKRATSAKWSKKSFKTNSWKCLADTFHVFSPFFAQFLNFSTKHCLPLSPESFICL